MSDKRLPLVINGEFGDVPAITGADIGKALTVNPGGTGYTYAAFATSAEVAAAVAAHVALGDPHSQYLLESAHAIAGAVDFTDTTGAGTDGYSVTWDNDTERFVLADVAGGGGGTPGGSDTQIQFNDGGAFGGAAGLVYNKTTDSLSLLAGALIASGAVSETALSADNVRLGVLSGTPRIIFEDSGATQWEIDNSSGLLRFINPGSVKLDVDTSGNLHILGNLISDGTGDTKFNVSGGSFGIGTSSPSGLDVRTSASIVGAKSADSIRLGIESGVPTFLLEDSGQQRYQIDNNAGLFRINHPGVRVCFSINTSGAIGIGRSDQTALLDVDASTTARASLRVRSGVRPTTPNHGDWWNDGAAVSFGEDATTNAIANGLKIERASSGTPAAGFGTGIVAQLESSTTVNQAAGRLAWEWIVATHASRAARGKLSAYSTSTEQEALRWDGDSGGVKLGFYGGAAVAQQILATGAGATVDQVITALQNLGLVKQS